MERRLEARRGARAELGRAAAPHGGLDLLRRDGAGQGRRGAVVVVVVVVVVVEVDGREALGRRRRRRLGRPRVLARRVRDRGPQGVDPAVAVRGGPRLEPHGLLLQRAADLAGDALGPLPREEKKGRGVSDAKGRVAQPRGLVVGRRAGDARDARAADEDDLAEEL